MTKSVYSNNYCCLGLYFHFFFSSQIVLNRYRKCRCHGLSGSCSVQTCYKRAPENNDIGQRIRNKYVVATKVRRGSDPPVPTSGSSAPVSPTTCVFVNDSPSFCVADPSKGIIGTKGRPCRNIPGVVDSCDVLCCQRGANAHVREVTRECCQFVWCCRFECRICGRYNETTYTCK